MKCKNPNKIFKGKPKSLDENITIGQIRKALKKYAKTVKQKPKKLMFSFWYDSDKEGGVVQCDMGEIIIEICEFDNIYQFITGNYDNYDNTEFHLNLEK
jgi:hypothetical protein